jgi:hypothetical protein
LDDPTDDNELANDLASALQADTLDRWSVAAADSVARFQWSLVMDQFEMAIVERAGQRAR